MVGPGITPPCISIRSPTQSVNPYLTLTSAVCAIFVQQAAIIALRLSVQQTVAFGCAPALRCVHHVLWVDKQVHNRKLENEVLVILKLLGGVMKKSCCIIAACISVLVFAVPTTSLPPADRSASNATSEAEMVDNVTYINANSILMFVTNHGNFGRDLADIFGNGYGTYFPYTTIDAITSGANTRSPLYAGGLWLGGLVNGQVPVAISEYSSEFGPGPMSGGTYQSDRPEFKVYKLHRDSLGDNPNDDYLNWPVDQGAPIDILGNPLMYGDQMTWSVFNDANPTRHTNNAGETDPLGVEVRMTSWAGTHDQGGFIYLGGSTVADHTGPSRTKVEIDTPTMSTFPGQTYQITFTDTLIVDGSDTLHNVWHLDNVTQGVRRLTNQRGEWSDPLYVDGFRVHIITLGVDIEKIEEIATDTGLVVPPDNVMYSLNSSGDWYVSSDRGGDFSRLNWTGRLGTSDWEFRFTAGGSEYYDWTTDSKFDNRAPFEVWNIGSGTPDDSNDDRRIFFSIIDDDASGGWSWGDRIYPWEVEYYEPGPASATDIYTFPDDFHIGRIVFADQSGLLEKPVYGTVTRFTTYSTFHNTSADTFTFTAPISDSLFVSSGQMMVYLQYELFNRGVNQINDMYVGLWSDPDLGGAGDDLVGCDTVLDAIYVYNATNNDQQYGSMPPAAGFRVVYGPLVPSSPDSTAFYMGRRVTGYRNLGMAAAVKYINGTDPDSAQESYNYMRGLERDGQPYYYNGQPNRFMHSGNPVTAIGDIDFSPSDRRMMASMGPFDFAPSDSQYVLIRFAIGQGGDRLMSLEFLKNALRGHASVPTEADEDTFYPLPGHFALSQNYPNPFNPTTTISFSLPHQSRVRLSVYNILGQKVVTLIDDTKPAGTYSVDWIGTNSEGRPVASGVYFYRLETGTFTESRKMLLLR